MPSISLAPICEAVRANLPLLTTMLSPSTNACVVRMTPIKGMKRYRYDPYRANVIAPSPLSCAKTEVVAAIAETVSDMPEESNVFGVLPEPTMTMPMPMSMPMPVMPMMPYPTYAYDMSSYYGAYMPPVVVGAVPASMPYFANYNAFYGADASLASSIASVPSTTAPTRVPSPVPPIAEAAIRRGVAPLAVDGAPSSEAGDDVLSECGAESEAPSVEAVTRFVSIKFKYETFTYSTPFPLSVGENVVVEGDRGIHMGVVTGVNVAAPADGQEPARVVRRPSAKDAQLWESLCAKAAVATTFAQDSVKDLALTKLMRVTDAEYQLDQNKLTIFFRSELLVDFRKLQRVLFKEFRCRVWLVNLDEVLDGVVLKKGPWSKMC